MMMENPHPREMNLMSVYTPLEEENLNPVNSPNTRRARRILDRLKRYATLRGTVVDGAEDINPLLAPDEEQIDKVAKTVEANPDKLAGKGKAMMIIFKSFVGTGILFIPRGFYNAGLVAGMVTLLLSGAITLYCMVLLLESRQVVSKNGNSVFSYGDLGYAVLGRLGKRAVHTAIILSQLGFVCNYAVFIASSLHALSAGLLTHPVAAVEFVPYITLSFVPFCFFHSLRALDLPNIVGNFLALACLIVLVVYNVDVFRHLPGLIDV